MARSKKPGHTYKPVPMPRPFDGTHGRMRCYTAWGIISGRPERRIDFGKYTREILDHPSQHAAGLWLIKAVAWKMDRSHMVRTGRAK